MSDRYPTPWHLHQYAGTQAVRAANGKDVCDAVDDDAARLILAIPKMRELLDRLTADCTGIDSTTCPVHICYFCKAEYSIRPDHSYEVDHEPDCPYMEAVALLEGIGR